MVARTQCCAAENPFAQGESHIPLFIIQVIFFIGVLRGFAPKPCREKEGFKGREKPRFGVGGFPSP